MKLIYIKVYLVVSSDEFNIQFALKINLPPVKLNRRENTEANVDCKL